MRITNHRQLWKKHHTSKPQALSQEDNSFQIAPQETKEKKASTVCYHACLPYVLGTTEQLTIHRDWHREGRAQTSWLRNHYSD